MCYSEAVDDEMGLLKEAQFHGALRLADNKDRWWWVAALFALLVTSTGLLSEILMRFLYCPTVLVKTRSVQDKFIFPSIVMCPEIDFPEEKVQQFLNEIAIPPGINVTILNSTINQLAAYYAVDVRYDLKDLERIQTVLDYNHMNVSVVAKRLTRNCSESIVRCGWRGKIVNCSELFTMEFTGVGFCCVVFGRSLRREIAEFGVHKVNRTNSVYTDMVGFQSGMMLAVEQSQIPYNIDLSYKWLGLQGGNGYVDIAINGTPLSPGMEQWFGFYQTRLKTSLQVRGWSDTLLKCRPRAEALKYFPLYTWRYCLLECEIDHTHRICGCVKASHPQLPGMKMCSASKIECSRHAAMAASSSDVCNCPPACEMENDITTVQSFPLSEEVYSVDPFYEGLNTSKVTIVRAYIFKFQSPVFSRRPIYSSLDLFANFGGIFNVYLGCSVLTVLELTILLLKCSRTCRNKLFSSSAAFKKSESNNFRRTHNLEKKLNRLTIEK